MQIADEQEKGNKPEQTIKLFWDFLLAYRLDKMS